MTLVKKVKFCRRLKKWHSYIDTIKIGRKVKRQRTHFGYFDTEQEARVKVDEVFKKKMLKKKEIERSIIASVSVFNQLPSLPKKIANLE